jgi:hypothetical protein
MKMAMATATLATAMTFKELAELEPGLKELLNEAHQVKSDGIPHFCANAVWDGRFKPRLVLLVGWDARQRTTTLQSERAYDVAYKTIYNALPDCRDCFCFR